MMMMVTLMLRIASKDNTLQWALSPLKNPLGYHKRLDTWLAKVAALVNMLRYLTAKVKVTGSSTAITTASSFLSWFAVGSSFMLPVPISPAEENLTDFSVQAMITESPNCPRSLTILWNSEEGSLITAW